jgi:hypothetical protein
VPSRSNPNARTHLTLVACGLLAIAALAARIHFNLSLGLPDDQHPPLTHFVVGLLGY